MDLKQLMKKVPGFRSGKPWKMVVATLIYLFFIFTLVLTNGGITIKDKFIIFIQRFVLVCVPFFLIAYMPQIKTIFKFMKNDMLQYIITFPLCFIIWFAIMGSVLQFEPQSKYSSDVAQSNTEIESTTVPPETTTQAPETTTAPPETTTQAPETTTAPPETTTQAPETTTAPPETTTQAPKSKAEKLGDYEVEIVKAGSAKDYNGDACIVVTYSFKNNSKNNASFFASMVAKAFQDGIELSRTYVSGLDTTDNNMKEIKTGKTIEVQEAYKLDNKSNIEVEVSELFSFDDKKVTKTFTFTE